ncbi:MAG: 3-phosphoshikimate 1-carboxyvinyltransferase [Acidobacteria bacterium]|nr:3-phosphoshikimate 1-carboxyvinyltransferase [Acidobacteriota bacterium]
MAGSSDRTVHPASRLRGTVEVPGDKSVSHRALMLGALAKGSTRIRGLAPGADCQSTRACLGQLGVRVVSGSSPLDVSVDGRGLRGLCAPSSTIDAGNSGTTARLLMGILAAHPFDVAMTGDASLRRRPMRRVAEPLVLMGARIDTPDGRLPLTVHGADLRGITYATPVPSAQVKTAILLAGLQAEGTTTVVESAQTRDHTERSLRAFGCPVTEDVRGVHITGRTPLHATDVDVPGDPSSAAFWAAAAAALPGSAVDIVRVGLNPTRTAFLDVLRRFGADVVQSCADPSAAEPCGTIAVRFGDVRPVEIEPAEVPGLIDELPVLAAMGCLGAGLTVRGAAELRVKESDRITALTAGLRQFGAEIEEYPDGFAIGPHPTLVGADVQAAGDHRLAMAFAVTALGASGPTVIRGADVVSVSYPGFFDVLERLCQ